MKITILGCCRQDPLYNLYSITPIRNQLTYTHYAQEILQAIKFCKKQNNDDMHNPYMFRSCILYPDKKLKLDFKRFFEETDLFVIELASRKSHFFNGSWLHEAYKDPKYAFEFTDEVITKIACTDEINQFIKEIIEELRPKKVMFVTHVYTEDCQHRKALSSEVKHACAQLNVPVFDPVEQFGGQSIIKNYLIQEDVIAHYNFEGNKLLQQYYENFIFTHFGYKPTFFQKIYKHTYSHLLTYMGLIKRVLK